jgi:putative ABC transport system ATP-binding protein
LSVEIVVRTTDLAKQYGQGEAAVRALDGVTCEIYGGEYLSIVGPSGSGKSTLFNMIGGLDKPTGGSVFINSVDIAQLTAKELAFLRCHTIGYIFQTFNLITVRTALENVTLPMLFAGLNPHEADERGMELLDLVGLGHRYHHRPGELSGGQQQRVAIARSLANEPSIILADEPTGNLDLKTGKEIIELLKRLNQERGVTVITATHDLKMLDVSDRIFHISDGKLAKVETRSEVQIAVGTMDS